MEAPYGKSCETDEGVPSLVASFRISPFKFTSTLFAQLLYFLPFQARRTCLRFAKCCFVAGMATQFVPPQEPEGSSYVAGATSKFMAFRSSALHDGSSPGRRSRKIEGRASAQGPERLHGALALAYTGEPLMRSPAALKLR